jgi:hypothetical protein
LPICHAEKSENGTAMIPATAEDIYKFFSVLDLRTNRGVTLIFCGDNLVFLAQKHMRTCKMGIRKSE